MMQSKKIFTLFLMSAFVCAFMACGDDDPVVVECITTDLTYTNYAKALIDTNCATAGCHDADAGSIGTMDTYANAKAFVDFGRAVGAVKHETGFGAMPKNGDKLSDCDISKFEAWINDGAPE